MIENTEEIASYVLQAQGGDKDAFGKVYDHFVDSIYKYIYFRVPPDEAEDLMETVFLKVWENLHQYDPDKSAFKSWIFRIAHNLVIDFYRLNKGIEELTEAYQDDRVERNPLYVTESGINSDILNVALKKLKKSYSQFLVLKFINDLSNAEISTILKKSEGSLRIIQYRALKQLKKVLASMGIKSL